MAIIAYLYGGNSTNVNVQVVAFNETVILPFIEILIDHLKSLIPEPSQKSANLVGTNSGIIIIDSLVRDSNLTINNDFVNDLQNVISEVISSNFKEKEQLTSLLKILAEDINSRTQDKGFLILIKEKLELFVLASDVITYANQLLPVITQILTSVPS
ncbi:hypothetical protein [Leptospira santarosai]|uniref:hypothetical protein n=1 Tax=Leptospira santarosai TaxID=28183 RepID=UPI0002489D83|nr:hypothetical protein [Leptospira santarosai]